MFSEWFFFFFEQYLDKLKFINLCLRESGSSSSNDNCHLSLEALSLVSNENILDSNPPFDNYQTKKVEFGSPPRLEGQYGCINLDEIHPSIGQLNRLFVLEGLYTSAPANKASFIEVISLLSLSLELLFPTSNLFSLCLLN